MNILELGAIGELVGGVAVIATLVYLALQVRQGNQAASREAYRAWVTDLNKSLFEPQLNADFNEVFQKANRDWDSIPPREQARVSAVYSNTMNLCQEGFARRARGEMEEDLARLLDFIPAVMLKMPGMATWWETASVYWSQPFCAHVQQLTASDEWPQIFPWYLGEASRPSVASENK